MKRIIRSAGVLLVISALLTPAAQAYYTVYGNGTATASTTGSSYAAAPQCASFYKPTGDYFVGLLNNVNTNAYALSSFNYRTTQNANPALTPLGSDATITDLNVGFLTVCPYSGATNGITTPTIVAYMPAAITLNAVTKANQTAAITGTPFDAAGAATSGVNALASGTLPGTTTDAVFAAVLAGAGGNFGTAGSGINGGILTQTNGAAGITLYNMQTGAAVGGNTGTALSANFNLAAVSNYARINNAATVTTDVDLHYDPLIGTSNGGTLYAAVQIQSGATAGDAAFGLGIYHVTAAAPSFLLTQTGIIVGAAADNGHIFYSISGGVNAANVTLYKVRTMHTSTGLAHVIVAGGAGIAGGTPTGAPGTVENVIYAIPVVNGTGTSADGLPANVTAFSTTAGYTTQANTGVGGAATQLYTTVTAAAQVGNGVLPIANGVGHQISDMYVDGDTVYVAINAPVPDGNNEGGIYSSQACFNSLGQIDHWTDWRKVVPNDMGNTIDGSDGRVAFAAVDGYTGHVLAISNATNNWAKVTQWTLPTGSPTTQPLLAAAVNSALGSFPCYSVLDMNSSTTGWGHDVSERLTLFGGEEKVCFAVTGSASQNLNTASSVITNTSINAVAANDAFYDYTNGTANTMLLTTTLPAGAGAVIALGSSNWLVNNNTCGFFFAGCAGTASTAPALYVLADATSGAGFAPKAFTGLASSNAINNLTWQKVTNVSGMPVKIVANGGGVHVLTRSASLDRVFSVSEQTTLAGLNTNFVVTASSGAIPTAGSTNSSLGTVKQIYDLVISVSATPQAGAAAAGNEQLMIVANDGIYTTSCAVGMQTPVNQLDSGWVKIDGTSTVVTTGFFTDYLAQPNYNRNPQTFWFANFAANAAATSVYNRNIEYQMSHANLSDGSLTSSLTYTENPTSIGTYNGSQNVNAYPQATAPAIYKTFPVTARLFYNDGARRFFIQKNPSDDTKYQVLVLPYNLSAYNITENGKTTMPDTVVASAGAFYWCREIGDTGRLMMGTSNGVISLQ